MLYETQRALVLISRCLQEKYKAHGTAEEAEHWTAGDTIQPCINGIFLLYNQ